MKAEALFTGSPAFETITYDDSVCAAIIGPWVEISWFTHEEEATVLQVSAVSRIPY